MAPALISVTSVPEPMKTLKPNKKEEKGDEGQRERDGYYLKKGFDAVWCGCDGL